jgi:outer membrane protein, heavy metal efflux system
MIDFPKAAWTLAVVFLMSVPAQKALSAEADEALIPGETVASLLDFARQHSPALQALAREEGMARHEAQAAGALPDPLLELELMDIGNAMNPNSATTALWPGEAGSTTWRVRQMIPYPGKRDLQTAIAQTQVQARQTQTRVQAHALRALLYKAHVAHYQSVVRLQLIEENRALAQSGHAMALKRYALGLAPQADVLRAQTALGDLVIAHQEASRAQKQAVARLNGLLGRPSDAKLGTPLALPLLPDRDTLLRWQENARTQAPQVARASVDVVLAEHQKAQTYRERYPDFGISLAHNQPRNGPESWDVMFEVRIPLQQGQRRAQEARAEQALEAARWRAEEEKTRLLADFQEAEFALHAGLQTLQTLRDTLLPQTHALVATALSAYQNGAGRFSDVIDAQKGLLERQLSLLEVETQAHEAVATLEQHAGDPWP